MGLFWGMDEMCIRDRHQAIDALVALHQKVGNIGDAKAFKEGILARAASGTTAIGDGIAIPHAKSEAVLKPGLAALTVPQGMDYQSMDGKLTSLLLSLIHI